MTLLYANDKAGAYPNSYYAATATPLPAFPPLTDTIQADVCVIGGGFTGLSTALHLAQTGHSVVLLEAHRLGFGASGRNGGQVGTGMRQDQDDIEALLGREDARKIWQIAEDAKTLVRSLATDFRPGVAYVDWSAAGAKSTADYARFLQDRYDYTAIAPLTRAEVQALIPNGSFQGGLIDHGAGHIHPLRFVFTLAQQARAAGVQIFEMTEALTLSSPVQTAKGAVQAEHIVLAMNGYHQSRHPKLAKRVLPINNFIIATEPLDPATVLTQNIAVADSKFVVNYWRMSEDHRLIFGGCESYGDRFPRDIAAAVRKPMLQIYPHLKHAKIDYAWGGTLAITPTRLPDFARLGPGLWTASGYSGHGVSLATYAGKILAQAIMGDATQLDLMGKMRPPAFPGLGVMRRPLLSLAMRWFALRDRLGL